MPNLFTLYTLQAFAACDSTTDFLKCHVTFAVLVLQMPFADKLRGVLDWVGCIRCTNREF